MTTWKGWPVSVSAALGLLVGAWLAPTWQDVIEPAQVIAGLIPYAPDNPVYLYSTGTWTLMHQLIAVALRLGLTEHTLAIVISGLTGALSFTTLSLTVRLGGGPAVLVALGPLLLYVSHATRFSPGYPVLLLGWPFTYGIVGHSLALLVLVLTGLRHDRVALLLLGLIPAVHPGIGALLWIVMALVCLVHRHEATERLTAGWRWFAAGLCVTLASGLVHVIWFAPDVAGLPMPSPELMRSVRAFWDEHRQPLDYRAPSVVAAFVGAWLIWWWRRDNWLGTALVAACAVAFVADVTARVSPEWVAGVINRPMPTRLLVLPLLACGAWMMGVVTGSQAPAQVRVCAYWLFATIAVVFAPGIGDYGNPADALRDWAAPVVSSRLVVAQVVLAVLVALTLLHRLVPARSRDWWSGLPAVVSRRLMTGVLSLLAMVHVAAGVIERHANSGFVVDRSNNVVLAAAAAGEGVLATSAGLHLMQAATRRPLLIDPGALDALVYVPSAIVVSDTILTAVYGVTLAEPGNADGAPQGALGDDNGDPVWVARSTADWQQLRERFGITQLLTGAHLHLQLPRVVGDTELTLWTIPAR